ncbi:hypothetical protein EIK77_004474 [Talaromyces pinophilus]|nr:hypothetical protein EIK77_004474 [Talaromyces pinophilus]PCG88884.1 hypothetical protein PENOC_109010 [Penicillium occitanis (nom. inval.)]PCG89363.1 Thiamine pyrophosphate enzyme, C-terminal TPP-binding [Penicillium occitanis (nom. inval.)]
MQWQPILRSLRTALLETGVEFISEELVRVKEPLIITGYSSRNHECVNALIKLATTVKGLRLLDTGGCDMCFPANHPGWLGMRFGADPAIETTDLIPIVDYDVPWIPTRCRPQKSARIFRVDIDPLKQLMPLFYVPAVQKCTAYSCTAINQVKSYIKSSPELTDVVSSNTFADRWSLLQKHSEKIASLDAQCVSGPNNTISAAYLCKKLKYLAPEDTFWVVEAATNTFAVADQIRATRLGQWINCGGGGLGWSSGVALGVKLAVDAIADAVGVKKRKIVVQIVGDGTFHFSVPSSVYWILGRYDIPILTIVLNNKGGILSLEKRDLFALCT